MSLIQLKLTKTDREREREREKIVNKIEVIPVQINDIISKHTFFFL